MYFSLIKTCFHFKTEQENFIYCFYLSNIYFASKTSWSHYNLAVDRDPKPINHFKLKLKEGSETCLTSKVRNMMSCSKTGKFLVLHVLYFLHFFTRCPFLLIFMELHIPLVRFFLHLMRKDTSNLITRSLTYIHRCHQEFP